MLVNVKSVLLGTTQHFIIGSGADWDYATSRPSLLFHYNSLVVESAALIVIMQTPLCNGDLLNVKVLAAGGKMLSKAAFCASVLV